MLTDQSQVTISGTVTNTGTRALDTPTLTVAMQSSTPVTQTELTAFFSGLTPPGRRIATQALTSGLTAGGTAGFTVTVPRADLPLSDTFDWGPRGLTVSAEAGDATGTDRTLLVWDSGYDVSPTVVDTLVPWTSDTSTGTQEEQDSVLTLARMTGVTLALDPQLLASSSDAATPTPTATPSASPTPSSSPGSADPEAQSGVTPSSAAQVMSTAREVIALPSWDSDLGALTLGKADSLLGLALSSRDSFDGSTPDTDATGASATPSPSSGATAPSASPSASATTSATPTPTTSPTPTGTSSTAPTPTVSAKIIHDVVWPTSQSFGLQVLQRFRDQVVIAPPGTLAPTEELDFTPVTRVEVDTRTGQTSTNGSTDSTATVLTSRSAISDLLAWSPSSAADSLDAEQALTALGAIVTRERPNQSRSLLAVVPRGTKVDDGLVRRVRALTAQRWIRQESFSQVASSETTDVVRQTVGNAAALDQSTSQAFSTLTASLSRIAPLSRAVSDPEALTSGLEARALRMLSATANPEERTSRATQLREQVDDYLSSVRAQPSVTINLVNKTAGFPVRVANNLPWAVKVRVTLSPSDPRLSVDRPTDTTIPAHSTKSVDVPVSAIGSGNIRVGLVVLTSSGTVLDDTQAVDVRMRAGWEDALTKTTAALLVVMFLLGMVRTVRRRRHAGAPGLSQGGANAPAGLEWVRVDEGGTGRTPDGGTPADPDPAQAADRDGGGADLDAAGPEKNRDENRDETTQEDG